MKFLRLLLLCSLSACGQSTGPAATKGPCSPAVSSSGNTINIKTCGLTVQQAAEWRSSFKKILEKQIDPKVLVALLDDIKSGLIRLEGGVLRIENRVAEIQKQQAQRLLRTEQAQALGVSLSTYAGQKITIRSYDAECKTYAESFVRASELARIFRTYPHWSPGNRNPTEATAGRPPSAANALLDAVIGLGATAEPRKTMFVNDQVPIGQIEFRVGLRPPVR